MKFSSTLLNVAKSSMANHKRGKPKNQRAGCLMCKPHKANGAKGVETPQELKNTPKLEEGLEEHEDDVVESVLAQCCPCGDENC
jgi:hypothetical protein